MQAATESQTCPAQETPPDDAMVTARFAAQYTGLNVQHIYALCETRKLPHFAIPGSGHRPVIRIRFGDVRKFLAQSFVEPGHSCR